MPNVIIDTPRIKGTYPLDLVFTHRDFSLIKRVAGVRANEVMDALNAGDLDIVVAVAMIALRRSTVPFHEDDLWDAPAGSITLEIEEDDAVPPAQEPPSESDDERRPSGDSSRRTGEHSPEKSRAKPSGTQG